MLANWLLSLASLPAIAGVVAVGKNLDDIRIESNKGELQLDGTLTDVLWGRRADAIVLFLPDDDGDNNVVAVPRDEWRITQGADLARRPRDRMSLAARLPPNTIAPAPGWLTQRHIQAAGAALTAVAMAGAIEALLEMTVRYCGERIQFGRPLAKFQAVQQELAELAEQSAAAVAAAEIAKAAFVDGKVDIMRCAVAKARIGEAAGKSAMIAHQLHGAMGFTEDYRLHFFTRFLWAARDDWGAEPEWQALLGQTMLDAGPDGFWPALTAI